MKTLKKTARTAGLFYVLVAIIASYALMYIPSKIIVWDDAAATANNMLANEFLFRCSIACRLISQVLMILVVWYLYQLFKQVDEYQSKLMVILYIMAVPIGFLVNVFNLTALVIFKGNIMQSLTPEQMHDLAQLFLCIGSWDTQMVQIFWGLWLLPFGWLVYKSGFIPRILGIFLIANGIAYIVICFSFVIIPGYLSIISKFAMPFFFIGEIPIMLWLVIKGVKTQAVK